MALTRDDIETAIEQTEHQDAIRHSLADCFEGLDEPVSVAIFLSTDRLPQHLLNRTDMQNVVNALREKGIDAVSMMDAEAALPSKFILNDKEIQTPFLSPEDALKATLIIEDVICNLKYVVLSGQVNLLFNRSILYTLDRKLKIYSNRGIEIVSRNPHADMIPEILKKYGEDRETFIDRKIREAQANSVMINTSVEQTKNIQNGYDTLWRGTVFIGKPYAAVLSENADIVARASYDIANSLAYTGYGEKAAGTEKVWFPPTKNGLYYGCLYKYKSSGNEQIYCSAAEKNASDGFNAENSGGKFGYDVIIYPHKNEVEAMYIQVGPSQFYPVPIDKAGNILDDEWRDFAKVHEPSDDTIFGYEAVRRDTQKREQKYDVQHCYSLDLQKDLGQKKYDCKFFAAAEMANVVAYRGCVARDGSGHFDFHQNVKVDIDPKKVDFKNVTIYGECTLYDIGTTSILNMPNIRENERGLSTKIIFVGTGILTDVDKVSTNDLLKIVGGWKKSGDYNLSTISVDKNIELANLPNDFGSYKYDTVSINCTVDKLEDFPNTTNGCSYMKVRDQSSIEEMTPDEFKSKIMGSIKANKTGENYILDLTTTNITSFPKGMENEIFNSVKMNPEHKILSLDNFPKTKNGATGIDFEGSLSNLTIEEFLLKIKGENWCQNNISENDDGSKIVNNFGFDENKLKIDGYPKDIVKYKFSGEPDTQKICEDWSKASEMADLLGRIGQPRVELSAKDQKHLKDFPELNLYHCKEIRLFDIDLSNIKVMLPKSGIIKIGKNVKFAPTFKLDLSGYEKGSIHPAVQCREVKLPKALTDAVEIFVVPLCVSEISTACIVNSKNIGKFAIPSHVKIVDTTDVDGKKIDLRILEKRGLTGEQLYALMKERTKASISSIIDKILPFKLKILLAKIKLPHRKSASKYSDISNDAKKAIMAKMGIKPGAMKRSVKTGGASIQALYKMRNNSLVQTHEIAKSYELARKAGMQPDEFLDSLRYGNNNLIGEDYDNETDKEVNETDISQGTDRRNDE